MCENPTSPSVVSQRSEVLTPGTYPCWRVLTRGPDTSAGPKYGVSDPITSEALALELAEKGKANIDNYHGPVYSKPWVWTNREQDLRRLRWSGSSGFGREEYLQNLVVAWASGSDVVAVVHSEVRIL